MALFLALTSHYSVVSAQSENTILKQRCKLTIAVLCHGPN